MIIRQLHTDLMFEGAESFIEHVLHTFKKCQDPRRHWAYRACTGVPCDVLFTGDLKHAYLVDRIGGLTLIPEGVYDIISYIGMDMAEEAQSHQKLTINAIHKAMQQMPPMSVAAGNVSQAMQKLSLNANKFSSHIADAFSSINNKGSEEVKQAGGSIELDMDLFNDDSIGLGVDKFIPELMREALDKMKDM